MIDIIRPAHANGVPSRPSFRLAATAGRDPMQAVLGLGRNARRVIVLALLVALLIHGTAAARAAVIPVELMRWSQSIQPIRKRLTPPPQPPISGLTAAAPVARRPLPTPGTVPAAGQTSGSAAGSVRGPVPGPAAVSGPGVAPSDFVRVICNKCQGAMRIPLAVLRGKTSLNVRCPKCQNIFTIRPRAASGAPATQAPTAAAQTNPPRPPGSPSAPAKPAGAPTATAAAQVKPSDSKPTGPTLTASKTPATSPSEKTKSPARPSVVVAPHKHAK